MGKVLIIDDDEMMSRAISTLIMRMGHDAKYAHTLNHGLEMALSEEFDIVFLDVLMPDGNGLDMLPKIKESGSKPEVIIVTASGPWLSL